MAAHLIVFHDLGHLQSKQSPRSAALPAQLLPQQQPFTRMLRGAARIGHWGMHV